MKRLRRKRTAAIAAVGAAVLALIGCSSAGSGSSNGGSATKGSVIWWSWSPDVDVAQGYITAFEKQYPNITVTYKEIPSQNYAAALRPALESNDGPDVYTVNANGAFSGQALAPFAYDLTPAMEKQLGPNWESKVYPAGTKAWTVDGKLIASEFAKQSAGVLWINQGLFAKYNLKPPTNLSQWVSVCQTFRSHGLGCFRQGMASTAGFILDTLHSIADNIQPGAWDQALAGTRKWTDPVFVQSLQILQTLTRDGIMDKGSVGYMQYPDVANAFLAGKVAMVDLGTWWAQNDTVSILDQSLAGAGVSPSAPKPTFLPIPFPDVAGTGNPSTIFSDPDTGNSVNAKSHNLNAAVTFALWLGTSKAGAQLVANSLEAVSTLHGASTQWNKITLVNPKVELPVLQTMTQEAVNASEVRAVGMPAQVNNALISACQDVTNGASPASVVGPVQQAAEQSQQPQ